MRVAFVALALACAPPSAPADVTAGPPVAPVRPYVHTEHGVDRSDPYFWLRDKSDPATRGYVEAENAWTGRATAPLEPLREALADELKARLPADDEDAAVKIGPWWVQERYVGAADYPIVTRRLGEGAPEEVVVDFRELARGHEYFDGSIVAWSADERLVAVAVDFEGDELYDVRFRDVAAGEWLPDVIAGVSYGGEWANDGKTFFYTRPDETMRPATIHRHVLGADPSADAEVYREDDRRFGAWLSKTRSERFLVVTAYSYSSTELRVLDADAPDGPFRAVVPREKGVLAYLDHQGDRFLVHTNACATGADCAVGFRLLALPLDADALSDGVEVLPARDDVTIEDVFAFADHFVVAERRGGAVNYVVHDRDGTTREAVLPDPFHDVWVHDDLEYAVPVLRFEYSTVLVPPTTYALDLATGALTVLDRDVVPDLDPAKYVTERLSATSADGTAVPVTVVRAIDAPRPAPLLLYGYGAYGVHVDPWFEAWRVSLLRRGVSFALCHVRGGGDLGRAWTLDGKLEHKQHSFDDLAACAEALIEAGETTPDRLALRGISAGGLLVAATVEQRPELFRAAIAEVPFVDVVTTMLDASIPLTAEEWEEWGDPRDADAFAWMLAYSPYDNVSAHAYPDLFVTAGWNDTSVLFHEPAKYVAKLRATSTGGQVLLRTNMDAGHGGDSGRYGALDDEALRLAWLLDRLGAADATPR